MYHWGKNDCPIPYSSPTLKLRHKVLWAHVFFLDTINSIINNESVMGDDFDFLHLLDEQDWQEAGLPRDPVFSAPAVQRV